MKIIKVVLCFLAFSTLLIGGCFLLYDPDAEEFADTNGVFAEEIAAEQTEAPTETAAYTESSLNDMPITELRESSPKTTSVTFTFLGDCILSSNAGDTRDDTFKEYAESRPASYFFERALPYYSDSDFVLANSEFVLSDRNLSKTPKSGTAFWFKSPSDYTDILKAGGIDIVTIANNHTYDYGEEGYEDTKASLDRAGIIWGDLENPIYLKKSGITFGIICTKLFNEDYDPLITPVIEEVTKNSDIQILFFHGGTEKEHIPDEWLIKLCRRYADMGVDLIVGSHPHVLRPMESYNGVDIIYSLGNFCYGANRLPENRTVILTETFIFDEDGSYISSEESFTPFYVYSGSHNNWQPAPITDPKEISKTLSFMYGGSTLP